MAFVIHVKRSTAIGKCAVIDNRNSLSGDLLSDFSRECRGPLTVKVALKTMANGLMQENAGPAGPKDNGHRPSRRGTGFKIN